MALPKTTVLKEPVLEYRAWLRELVGLGVSEKGAQTYKAWQEGLAPVEYVRTAPLLGGHVEARKSGHILVRLPGLHGSIDVWRRTSKKRWTRLNPENYKHEVR